MENYGEPSENMYDLDHFRPQFNIKEYADEIRKGNIRSLYDFKKYKIYNDQQFGDSFVDGLNNQEELKKIMNYELHQKYDQIY